MSVKLDFEKIEGTGIVLDKERDGLYFMQVIPVSGDEPIYVCSFETNSLLEFLTGHIEFLKDQIHSLSVDVLYNATTVMDTAFSSLGRAVAVLHAFESARGVLTGGETYANE